MNDVPLIQTPDANSINTSIIAIKKQLKTINEALGLIDMPTIDTSIFVKKSEVVDVVEADNMNPVTSNAVAEVADSLEPVDEVTLDNMQSVTSNAVAEALGFVDIKSQCTFSSSSTGFYIYKSNNFVLLICDRNAFSSQEITLPSGVNVILRQINYNVTGDYFFAGNTNKISFVSNGNHYINLSALFVIG